MYARVNSILVLSVAIAVSALPENQFINYNSSDDVGAERYNPATNNVYHLFTRENPSISNPLLLNNRVLLDSSNYANSRRTVLLIHGFRDHATSPFNAHLVPALLQTENLNVIVVDWSSGASGSHLSAVANAVTSGNSVAAFINWLNSETGSSPVQYHIVGHGLGGHQAGIAARRTNGVITYVTGLDPTLIGWINHSERFQASDGLYTEVIHTNIGANGYVGELAKVDFYPNGGEHMPGCETNACSHEKSYLYFAESLISGGFTGRRCSSLLTALMGACNALPGTLQLGGITPKIGFVFNYKLNPKAANSTLSWMIVAFCFYLGNPRGTSPPWGRPSGMPDSYRLK